MDKIIRSILICAALFYFLISVAIAQSADEKVGTKNLFNQPKIDVVITSETTEYARKQVDQDSHLPISNLGNLAVDQLQSWGTSLEIKKKHLENAKVAIHDSCIIVTTNDWMYRCNAAGIQTFRPISNLPSVSRSLRAEIDPSKKVFSFGSLSGKARSLFHKLDLKPGIDLPKTTYRKEELVVGQCRGGSRYFYEGRSLVRLSSNNYLTYFQVVFDTESNPIRVDTNIETSASKQISILLGDFISTHDKPSILRDTEKRLLIGSFFNPDEYRFEIDAKAIGGRDFTSSTYKTNPFQRGNFNGAPSALLVNGSFNMNRTDYVNVQGWENTDDFKFWQYEMWNRYGRQGGLRGNFIPSTGAWNRPNTDVQLFPLPNYHPLGGEPNKTKPFRLSDNRIHDLKNATSVRLEDNFYRDLEQCTVAFFSSHIGIIQNSIQIKRSADVWFKLGSDDHKLGSGELRCILFNGCDSIGYLKSLKEGKSQTPPLFTEWMSGRFVDGLRIVCGADGEMDTSGKTGWIFSARYNGGDSLSDAWALGAIEESSTNSPVSVAFGASAQEAFGILLDGRLSAERAQPIWACASIWKVAE